MGRSTINSSTSLLLFAAFILVAAGGSAQEKLTPDLANVSYGPHERNVLDLWKARSEVPTPLVIFFHGGGFTSGSKEKLSAKLLATMLEHGISVMAVNYRLLPEARYPEPLLDCIRSIQFARLHSAEWKIDPKRIGLAGSSAGALAALWIAFHDEMMDSNATEPLLRLSTRVRCVALLGQTVLEPSIAGRIIGKMVLSHSFFKGMMFGLKKEDLSTPHAEALFKEASPVSYLTSDDPPVWAYYSVPFDEPKSVSDAIHHPNFGRYLKERMAEMGIECTVVHKSDETNATDSCVEFVNRHLRK